MSETTVSCTFLSYSSHTLSDARTYDRDPDYLPGKAFRWVEASPPAHRSRASFPTPEPHTDGPP